VFRVGGACGPPPPVAAPLAGSLRAPSRGDPPRTCCRAEGANEAIGVRRRRVSGSGEPAAPRRQSLLRASRCALLPAATPRVRACRAVRRGKSHGAQPVRHKTYGAQSGTAQTRLPRRVGYCADAATAKSRLPRSGICLESTVNPSSSRMWMTSLRSDRGRTYAGGRRGKERAARSAEQRLAAGGRRLPRPGTPYRAQAPDPENLPDSRPDPESHPSRNLTRALPPRNVYPPADVLTLTRRAWQTRGQGS
jgi:hypothetical protein